MNAIALASRRRAKASDTDASFDRVGARAWALAFSIVGDERLAEEILVATFTRLPIQPGLSQGDAGLLFDVRERALASTNQPFSPIASASIGRADTAESGCDDALEAVIKNLPEPQRRFIELALFGKLSSEELAAVSGTPRSVVTATLAASMRTLQPILIHEETNEARSKHSSEASTTGESLLRSA